jgi:hypothetical protein
MNIIELTFCNQSRYIKAICLHFVEFTSPLNLTTQARSSSSTYVTDSQHHSSWIFLSAKDYKRYQKCAGSLIVTINSTFWRENHIGERENHVAAGEEMHHLVKNSPTLCVIPWSSGLRTASPTYRRWWTVQKLQRWHEAHHVRINNIKPSCQINPLIRFKNNKLSLHATLATYFSRIGVIRNMIMSWIFEV